jgi:glyoxylase-like metal-dependent hydrolase (beta-lactamase superfamily II)/8-oxo-dGTP pyrophosphatase MutT (NUDIX family)
MVFGPGLHVFPGGAVDPADRDPRLVARCAWGADACAGAWAGDLAPDDAIAHALAAVRELYEEAGILLADHGDQDIDGDGGPGGPIAPGVLEAAVESGEPLADIVERLDLVVRTDRLVPLSRWVTPRGGSTRRYDTRFFAAALPAGVAAQADPHEVAAHEWLAPEDALVAAEAGRILLWPPTATTVRQLVGARGLRDVEERLTPRGPTAPPEVDMVRPGCTRVRLHGAGGIPGSRVDCWLIGHREVLVVDPGDPGEAALDAITDAVAAQGGRIGGIVLTAAVPDHAAGALMLADRARVGVNVAVGAGSRWAAGLVAGPVVRIPDGAPVAGADVPVSALATPGTEPGQLALLVPSLGVVLVGDLDGPDPDRGTIGRTDSAAREVGRARVDDAVAALGATGRAVLRLPAHG